MLIPILSQIKSYPIPVRAIVSAVDGNEGWVRFRLDTTRPLLPDTVTAYFTGPVGTEIIMNCVQNLNKECWLKIGFDNSLKVRIKELKLTSKIP